ncbi:MAG: TolC family protein [Bacteroidales bacterium]|nr:TolC family protein [Bacteroidales bacterium]
MSLKRITPQIIALSFSFFILGLGSVLAQKVWTLDECVNYALENNIQIKQVRLQTETAEINLLQSKLDFAPSANAGVNLNYNFGRNVDPVTNIYSTQQTMNNNYNLNGKLDLFKGMQKWNSLKKSELDYEASLYRAEEMEDNISLNLTAAYLNILFNHEMLLVAEQQIEVTKKQIERSSKLVEAGSLPKGDLLEIRAQAATEETNLITAENNLLLSYLTLKQILDLPANTALEIDQPEITLAGEFQIIPSEQVYAKAVDIMPEIKSVELSVESAERSVSIAKGGLYPSLSMSGGIGTNYNDKQREVFTDPNSPIMSYGDQIKNNRGEYLTFSLSIPIFNAYAMRSNLNRVKVQSISKNYDLQLQKNELRKNIEQKYHDAIASYKTFNASRISVESLVESFKYTQEKFDIGMVNSVDYSIAKMKLTNAQSSLLRAKYDYIFKTKILDFYMGVPLSL